MSRYFKLVCLPEDPMWYFHEFLGGQARFGWSGQGLDLRGIKAKDPQTWSDAERVTWSYTKFLLERIVPGDRVVIQTEQPLLRFLIGEVVAPGYDFSPGDLDDYNHVLHIKPLTPEPIPVNSKAVSAALKHDLSKRGQYYEIYPESSVSELARIVTQLASKQLDLKSTRTDDDTLDHTLSAVKRNIVLEISRKWPAKDFERFCALLCSKVDSIEIKECCDRRQGWDFLVRIINPLTQTILLDNVPVQCKNYSGEVSSHGPIDDLERSIRNSKSQVAYLFILGQLSEGFRQELARRQELLAQELHDHVSFEVVGEDRIAELYATFVVQNLNEVEDGV